VYLRICSVVAQKYTKLTFIYTQFHALLLILPSNFPAKISPSDFISTLLFVALQTQNSAPVFNPFPLLHTLNIPLPSTLPSSRPTALPCLYPILIRRTSREYGDRPISKFSFFPSKNKCCLCLPLYQRLLSFFFSLCRLRLSLYVLHCGKYSAFRNLHATVYGR